MDRLINVAAGREKADLVLKNCKIVDVFSKNVILGDIVISGEYIAGIGNYSSDNEYDIAGKYVMPGFIDSHVHIESSMVTPTEYAKAVMINGVTTIIADPHEIANVCGENGINFMMKCADSVPLTVEFMIPSCVPATSFEHSGACIDSVTINKLMSTKFLGLGEMMNYPGVINADYEVLAKLKCADIIDGHAPLVTGNDLNAYVCAGIKTDHECTTINEMSEKISKGMYIQIREGTLSKNLEELVGGINPATVKRCTFCSDDRYLGDIIKYGTINYCISKAISLGVEPLDAITIATINAAECYGLKKVGAIAPGYFADLVIADDLSLNKIDRVYKNGILVAQDNKALFEHKITKLNDEVLKTVHLPKITSESFKITTDKNEIPVIRVNKGTIVTTKVMRKFSGKLSKVAVIERHKMTGNIGLGFVENYDITGGAIASTIGHDSHNVIVIGDNDEDMAFAVNSLGESGGIAVCSNGEILERLELPIAGLLSDKPISEVLKSHERLNSAAKMLRINPEIDAFMTLAFLPLPVIPEIRITDMGLFDVTKFEFMKI